MLELYSGLQAQFSIIPWDQIQLEKHLRLEYDKF